MDSKLDNKVIEVNNRSMISVEGSEVRCKVFVYIRDNDTDILAVNNKVAATQDANGDINVYAVEVIEARKKDGDKEELIEGFGWANLPVIKKAIGQYLRAEIEEYDESAVIRVHLNDENNQ